MTRDNDARLERGIHVLFTLSESSNDGDLRWIILDGPVDTTWVENLNTALDDTKTLCLANGERISLSNQMRVLFEVDTLTQVRH